MSGFAKFDNGTYSSVVDSIEDSLATSVVEQDRDGIGNTTVETFYFQNMAEMMMRFSR